jgi:hypothetical protein
LFSVGVSLKNSNNKEPTDEQPSSSKEQNETKQKQRNFQTEWLSKFKWNVLLTFDVTQSQ